MSSNGRTSTVMANRFGEMERCDPDRDAMTVDVLPFDDMFGGDGLVGERQAARSSLAGDEGLLCFEGRCEFFVRLDDRGDEVVDVQVEVFPHLLDSADDLASVRFGLELRRHAKVEVDLTMRRLHPDDLGGERFLEAHHRRFDLERLPVRMERVRTALERLLQLARGPGPEQ